MGLGRITLCGLTALSLWLPFFGSGARADTLAEADKRLRELDEQMGFVESQYTRRDESAAARAQRKYAEGEIEFLLEDYQRATILLYDAIDERDFRASQAYTRALYYLGESLYQLGSYGSARGYFKQILDMPAAPNQRDAVLRFLDIAIRTGKYDGVDKLMERARAVFPGGMPPEILYLSAKATYHRADLSSQEQRARALQAFAAVRPPYQFAAAYFQGVIHVRAENLPLAVERFEHCARLRPTEDRQRQIREYCFLALGRVYSEMGRYAEALDRYQEIPRESPRFNEALYEIAWGFVKSKKYEQALRTASMISDLEPDSVLAPEATLLQGHLLLKLGRYDEALQTYNQVVDQYGPVRDEIDAVLTVHEDPVRYFNELIGRSGKTFDIASILPSVAVKWATTQSDVGTALRIAETLDSSRRDIEDSRAIADRVLTALSLNEGLDAFPFLQEGYARSEAIENGAIRVEEALAAAERELVPVPLGTKAELGELDGSRAMLESKLDGLPQTPAEVSARQARMRSRVSEVSREAFQIGYLIDACNAAITASQTWLDRHHADADVDPQGRLEFFGEMRKHREVVAEYERELRRLQLEIAKTTDGLAGSEFTQGEEALRDEYRRLVARQRALLAQARDGLKGSARAQVDRIEALQPRIERLLSRAAKTKASLISIARLDARTLRARVQAEQVFLDQYAVELNRVQGDAKDLVGHIAYNSFRQVRAQFYKLVLKADVGIIDVAWARKRERLEEIQRLSSQKTSDMADLDVEFQPILREVDE